MNKETVNIDELQHLFPTDMAGFLQDAPEAAEERSFTLDGREVLEDG